MAQPAAGWYQDPHGAPGQLRYWDGLRWTEYRAAPPPGPRPRERGWFARHKVLTAFAVLLVLAAFLELVPDDRSSDDTTGSAAPTTRDAASSPGGDENTGEGQDTGPTDEGATDRGPKEGSSPPAGAGTGTGARTGARAGRTFLVTRIVDGDTIELGNGETVRLVGIDTPEVGECGFEAASANLSRLVLGKRVHLTLSDENRDGYGRLLRYVDVGPMDAGLRLIKNGRAIAAYDSRDGYGYHPREPRYIAADRASKNLCRMATGNQSTPKPSPKPQPFVDDRSDCASGYEPCIPPYPPDLDCADVDGPIHVSGSDPHRLDADGDGIACEW